jgi:hypothetical protein
MTTTQAIPAGKAPSLGQLLIGIIDQIQGDGD